MYLAHRSAAQVALGAGCTAALLAGCRHQAREHARVASLPVIEPPPVMCSAAPTTARAEPSAAMDASTFTVRLFTRMSPGDVRRLRVVVGDATSRPLSGEDFYSPDGGPLTSEQLVVAAQGELPVRVALLGASGDTLATIRVVLTLAPGYRLSTGIPIGRTRPFGHCVGPIAAAPLRPSAGGSDTLFVDVGGTPVNAVC